MTPAPRWPRWATETVDIVDPDPGWADRGRHEVELLTGLLARWLTEPVEHVGSTAVPGLPAKPIIDLQAVVGDLDCADAVAAALAPAGWHAVPPELDRRPWRRFLVRVVDDRRAAHLHLLPAESTRWYDQLAFRDALRASPSLAAEYAGVKRDLATRHRDDREAYTDAKTAFIHRVLGSRGTGDHTPAPDEW